MLIATLVAFSYFDLALQKCHEETRYTIHGLWPEYTIHKWPQFCNKTEYHNFNETKIKTWHRIDEMHKHWPSCIHQPHKDDYSFWKHEWEKHGTCTNMTVLEFFSKTLDLYKKSQSFIDVCCRPNWRDCLVKFNKSLVYEGSCHKRP